MVHSIQLAESLQPLIDEMISDDSAMSLLGDNAAAVRAFELAGTGWRNRHLRMRAVAGRERILAGILKVAHLPGEFQVADLGTKPLSRTRIFQLLSLINIREPVVSSTEARTARVLSRVSLGGLASGSVSAKAVAGLVLLASLPRVTGQFSEDQVALGRGWLTWIVGVVVALAAGVVGCWFLGFLGPEGAGSVTEPSEGEGLFEGSSVAEEVVEPGTGEAAEDPTDDEFSQAEWEQAQRKLIEAEKATGLTFLQRAKLRKQLARGDLVDPPTFQQRYGPLLLWLTGKETDNKRETVLARTSECGLVTILNSCGVVMLALIGVPRVEWARLRVCGKRLRTNTVIALASRVRDTGSLAGMPQGADFHAEFRFESDGDGPRWKVTELRGTEATGSSSSGSATHDRLELQQPSGTEADGGLQESRAQSGASSFQGPAGSVAQLHPSSTFDFGAMPLQSSEEPGVMPLQSSEEPGVMPLQSSEEPGVMPLQSSVVSGLGLGISVVDPSELSEGSEDSSELPPLEPLPGAGFDEAPGVPGVEGEFCGDFEAHLGGLFGGSGSSGDVFRPGAELPEVTTGGASSSHGWATQLEGCYEDVVEPVDVCEFPMVGTWLRLHFLVQLMSTAGEVILAFLGERSEAWGYLRCTSLYLRAAIVAEVASILRKGPRALEFEGPQWFEVVDRWIVVGWLGGSTVGGVPGSIFQSALGGFLGEGNQGVGAEPAHAGEVPQPAEEDREDNPELDEYPYRGVPGLVGVRQVFAAGVGAGQGFNAESSSEGSSTTEPSVVTVSRCFRRLLPCRSGPTPGFEF